MKYLLLGLCLVLSALLASCANTSNSSQQVIEFKTLTLERARARVGRAAIMGFSNPGGSDAAGNVTITRIGGQSIAAGYNAIILDAVPHSVGVRLDDGSERFFSMTLMLGKRYLVMTHRHTESDGNNSTRAEEKPDLWVVDIDTNEVVFGEQSATTKAAMRAPALAPLLERHRAYLRSLFLDAS